MKKIDAQHWPRVKEVFEGALDLHGSERSEFIARSCADDAALREEVESLLRSFGEAGSFMESPAVAAAAHSLVDGQKKLAAGQLVKHYQILEAIGEGGMGEVYLAKDTILSRRVALKVLPEYVGKDPDRLRRFKQEARSASALNHPNVCVIHEIGETDDGRPFIAMEYIDGVTLRQRMNERPMKLGHALDIAIEVADALTAAHEAGIVHRDIKPENIMIRHDGYVKVFDFGLAKLTERHATEHPTISTLLVNSSPGTVMGTAAYMSPEQARGVTVDERTDIWSLGVVLYEMVSGRPPFVGETPTDVVVAIVEKEPPAVSQLVNGAPAELERIVKKSLRKDVNQRYQIAKEMAIDLRSLKKELEANAQLDRSLAPATATDATTISGRQLQKTATGEDRAIDTNELQLSRATNVASPVHQTKRWPRLLGLAAMLLIAVTVAFGIYKWLKRPEKPPIHFQQLNVTKLTTNGSALFASISPDGKYVAYVKSENGQESLWLRQVGSAGNLEIAAPRSGHYLGLAFSPDGVFIYYGFAITSDNEAAEIFKVPVLGTGAPPVKVSPEEGPSTRSHDGKRIAFLRHRRAEQADMLVVANADGSNEQTLKTRKWPERFAWDWSSSPAWTNDDLNLELPLVNADANGFYLTIYELRLADLHENIIPLNPQRFEQPNHVGFLADASAIILAGRAQGASFEQIWYLSRDGSIRPLTNDLSDYRAVMLTADSKSFVTTQTQTLGNIWATAKGDLAHANQVTAGFGRYFDLSWAPDGKIIYASDASGSADIYEIAPAGGNVRQLTSGVKRNYAPAVSPDNRFILFHSNRSGVFQIWRMDRDGSNPVQLTFGNSESHWPQFSADGKTFIYEHFEPGATATMWRLPVEGGTPAKVTDGFAVRPVVSPDGKWLGYWQNDGQPGSSWRVGLFSVESGKQVRTFDVASTVQIGWDKLLRWSADSQSLTYVDNRGGKENIWAQPITGGPAKQLTNFNESKIFSFDWSRDGNLVVSKGTITSDVVLVTDAGQ
ncbi:MAG TPA: protein kinase [Pyrinomonadaceae bacterium]|jgi:serine/threonine protein kinase